jgi:hypothetical protein
MTKFNLQQFNDGQSHQQALLQRSRGLVEKWAPTGLLENVNKKEDLHGLAILLENQYRQLLREATRTGTAEGSEEWAGVALPLVRRVFGEIVAKEFVSVQPMNLPSGLIFFLDFKYGSNQPGFQAGDSLFGETEVEGDPTGGLYGETPFGYSINEKTVDNLVGGSGGAILEVNEVSDVRIEFDPNLTELTGTAASGERTLRRVKVNLPTTIDTEGVRAFTIADTTIEKFYPVHTNYVEELSDGTHVVEFVVLPAVGQTLDADTDVAGATVEYQVQPTSFDRGDFEDRSDNPNISGDGGQDIVAGNQSYTGYDVLDIPEIDFDLRQEPIAAKTRKLKAVWTPELAQDLNAYHSIDAEAELTSMLSEYVSMEIDLEILDMLISNALTREFWSARTGYEYDSTTGQFVNAGSHTGTKNEWFQTLGNKIQRVSNRIYQKTLRGGANFLVTSPQVATILESIEGYRVDTGGDQAQFAMGVQRVGTLYNRFTVYKNPYMKRNIILVGFRGQNFLETGAVYAPYIPLVMTPIVYDPNNFTPRRGVMTRYAKKIVRPEFYGTIVVENPERV